MSESDDTKNRKAVNTERCSHNMGSQLMQPHEARDGERAMLLLGDADMTPSNASSETRSRNHSTNRELNVLKSSWVESVLELVNAARVQGHFEI